MHNHSLPTTNGCTFYAAFTENQLPMAALSLPIIHIGIYSFMRHLDSTDEYCSVFEYRTYNNYLDQTGLYNTYNNYLYYLFDTRIKKNTMKTIFHLLFITFNFYLCYHSDMEVNIFSKVYYFTIAMAHTKLVFKRPNNFIRH
ncbi:hypothetical protein EKK58_01785 [Candidatus Dependentiae bacterium]|nr:MAG: hypothetical protein EKK58_01785 [Candidatus Dependentiae bacterium]